MNRTAGRGQRVPFGEHGAEGGKRAAVGFALAADPLIGEAADPVLRLEADEFLQAQQEIDTVLVVLSTRLGPASALLAARADVADGLDSDQVEAVSGRIKAGLTARFPVSDQLSIDITDATAIARARAAARLAVLVSSLRGEER